MLIALLIGNNTPPALVSIEPYEEWDTQWPIMMPSGVRIMQMRINENNRIETDSYNYETRRTTD